MWRWREIKTSQMYDIERYELLERYRDGHREVTTSKMQRRREVKAVKMWIWREVQTSKMQRYREVQTGAEIQRGNNQ